MLLDQENNQLSITRNRYIHLIYNDFKKISPLIFPPSKKLPNRQTLLISRSKPLIAGVKSLTMGAGICIEPTAVNQYLGQELSCVIFDASEHFDVNAFTAICGCIVGGGELILNLPAELLTPTNEGSNFINSSICPLLQSFVKIIVATSSPEPIKHFHNPLSNNPSFNQLSFDDIVIDAMNDRATGDFSRFKQQQQTIEKIKRCALGHAKRPLVITAHRGRGKSTCLAIAAAQLAKDKRKHIIVTAPRKASLGVFFLHLQKLYQGDNAVYFPPDKLIKEKPKNDLIIVDEAGGIPVQMLKQIIAHNNRVVFATTVDGYEGNGRGFEIRFKSILDHNFPQWRSATLKTAVRWGENDPLEQAINQAFMLTCGEGLSLQPTAQPAPRIGFKKVSQFSLLENRNLLKQVYSLLVEAHYQTRPSDLQKILSDQSMRIFVALANQQVVATALVCQEGKFDHAACQAIEKGEKRVAGHLLPQSLMAYQGDVSAGQLKYWRVMRIATQAAWRGRKIATQLIAHVEEQAQISQVDLLGVSFSLHQAIMKFWYRLGFQCSRLALTKDSSTGRYPGEFIKRVTQSVQGQSPLVNAKNQAAKCYDRSLGRFRRSFFYSINASYANIEPAVLLSIIKNQIRSAKKTNKTNNEVVEVEAARAETVNQNDQLEIKRYLEKARSYEMVEWQLSQCLVQYLTTCSPVNSPNEQAEMLLVAKLLQNKTWQQVCWDFGFKGKKIAQQAIRDAINLLV